MVGSPDVIYFRTCLDNFRLNSPNLLISFIIDKINATEIQLSVYARKGSLRTRQFIRMNFPETVFISAFR